MVIDRANAFYLRPLADESAQSGSKVLDFGVGDNGGKNNLGGFFECCFHSDRFCKTTGLG